MVLKLESISLFDILYSIFDIHLETLVYDAKNGNFSVFKVRLLKQNNLQQHNANENER